jgi:hypothetical protein
MDIGGHVPPLLLALLAAQVDVAEMDFRAFGLQADGAGDDVEAGCLVDELAIDLEFQICWGKANAMTMNCIGMAFGEGFGSEAARWIR